MGIPEHPAFGCFSELAFDEGRDGTIDGTSFSGYDEAHPDRLLYVAEDLNGNGLLEGIEIYERDAAGNETRRERQRSYAEIWETTRDERGNPVFEAYDVGADGRVDAHYFYTWDAQDALLSYESDLGADGSVEYSYYYKRSPSGLALSVIEDDNGDGEAEREFVYTYDELDRYTVRSIDEGPDGVIDEIVTYAYTDPLLTIGTSAYDGSNDGVIDEIAAFEYDEEGRELYYSLDSNADGLWEWERTTIRDEEGRVLSLANLGTGSAGPYEGLTTYTYDELGRTVQETVYFAYESGVFMQNEQSDITFGGTCP